MDRNWALVGTAKGLVAYDLNEPTAPKIQAIHFEGFAINLVFVDKRSDRWWVGVSHKHWGQKLHYSDDDGASWFEVGLPSLKGYKLPNGEQARLMKVWSMAAGGTNNPQRLWLGTEPGGLFVSNNGGDSFQLVESLWYHPSRAKEGQWFGAGSDHPFIHSIVVNPLDSDHLYIAVSCAGVFETKDGGATWNPKNKGLKAAYLPNPNVEVGHDPHLLLMSPTNPQILWQQNHCGIFYSRDGGADWIDCTVEGGIPNYGFGIVIDEDHPEKAWVIPVQSDEQRIAPDLKLEVFRTDDFGRKWVSDSAGLPTEACFDIVLRHAFAKKNNTFVFGTTSGNLFYRNGLDRPWSRATAHLTKVNSVVLI